MYSTVRKSSRAYDEYMGAVRYNSTGERAALGLGTDESPLSLQWARSLSESFLSMPYPVENDRTILNAFLSESHSSWVADISWNDLPWYLKNKSMNGCWAYFAGVEFTVSGAGIQANGFSSCYNAFFVVESGGELRQPRLCTRNNHYGRFWSGYPPAYGGKYIPSFSQSFFATQAMGRGDILLMVTPSIGRWLSSAGHIDKSVAMDSNALEAYIKSLMKKGVVENTDSAVVVATFA